MDKMSLKAMLARKSELSPKEGYNVVGVDSFELGADALYLIGHYATLAEAEATLKRESRKTKDKLYIYEPHQSGE